MSMEANNDVQTPKPGIYRDVPFTEYLGWKALSNSRMNLAMQSLRHFKEVTFTEPTPQLRLGSFVHCGVLEPLAISMRYAVMPRYELDKENTTSEGKPSTSKTTSYYKAQAAAFAAANRDKEIVDLADYEKLVRINKSLCRSDRAREYLGERGDAEVSLLWEDAETGLLCKARIDMLNSGINDLKTTGNICKFPSSIADYGYHRQAAHYQDGLATLCGGEIKPFRIIAVESTMPHGVRAAPMSEDALEVGHAEIVSVKRAIADAYAADEWPCYPDPNQWNLPSWYHANASEPIALTINGETVTL